MKRVVVTGIGAFTPIGNTYQEYVNGLLEGKSGANPITRFDASKFKTRFAAEVKDYVPEERFHRRDVRRLDRFSQFAMIVAEEAMNDSGLDISKIKLNRAGVIWGSGIGGFETIEKDIEDATLNTGTPRYSPFLIPKLIADIAPGHISMKYGFRGVNYTTMSACASSSHSISAAFDTIRLGRCDVMITGGSEAAITKAGIGGFSSMKALSERNDDPLTASRPFDKDRDGFLLGEGGGALILEEYEFAKARGAKIYAEVIGAGATADAYHMTAPHPEGLGASEVMQMALNDANIQPSEVDYINVHGTSTPLGDIAETKAIKKVFGDHIYDLNISSTKSMTGHLLGAAGAVEAIACIVAINESMVPPTINHFTDDPELDEKINFTFNKAQKRDVKVALSNTFGFGGHNSTVIFKKM
ncbi:MAG: beta-ketoacyl-ACP synthase II [Saprospiraceae bacterium]|nr:beta-ketoacyl-ACP synthase II [Bacteroidia bacterium]NNE13683.1 beta-ketoacyl-ACP synthase II [Saprospiraceae bacterium]NNL90786.1 beta-ketoacyl-ACP synthase II [Saprospiraceae bacterium]